MLLHLSNHYIIHKSEGKVIYTKFEKHYYCCCSCSHSAVLRAYFNSILRDHSSHRILHKQYQCLKSCTISLVPWKIFLTRHMEATLPFQDFQGFYFSSLRVPFIDNSLNKHIKILLKFLIVPLMIRVIQGFLESCLLRFSKRDVS